MYRYFCCEDCFFVFLLLVLFCVNVNKTAEARAVKRIAKTINIIAIKTSSGTLKYISLSFKSINNVLYHILQYDGEIVNNDVFYEEFKKAGVSLLRFRLVIYLFHIDIFWDK